MTAAELRGFDLRAARPSQLRDALKASYPHAMKSVNDANLRLLGKFYKAGIPLDYLEADWGDYQASERKPLATVRTFAANISFHAHTGGGLVLAGGHGSGKSFLSYMLATEAIRAKLPTVCFSVREWVDKKVYQRHNPSLFNELLKMLSEASVVVVDNLSREGDKLFWGPEDVFDIVDRTVSGGGKKRCLVINTNMSKKDYDSAAGGSALSRTATFELVTLRNEDFRDQATDLPTLLEFRASGDKKGCFKHLSFDAASHPGAWMKSTACRRCAYSARARLCELRVTGKWKDLEDES